MCVCILALLPFSLFLHPYFREEKPALLEKDIALTDFIAGIRSLLKLKASDLFLSFSFLVVSPFFQSSLLFRPSFSDDFRIACISSPLFSRLSSSVYLFSPSFDSINY
jgi:hypothetical protein